MVFLCKKGDCSAIVHIMNNPLFCDTVTLKIQLEKSSHIYKDKPKRLFGEERRRIGELALKNGSMMTHLDLCDQNAKELYSEDVVRKSANENVEKPISNEFFFKEMETLARWDKASDAPYIRSYEHIPFSIILATDYQLNFLKLQKKNSNWENPLVLSLDISGRVAS